jgi:hypothetical protein
VWNYTHRNISHLAPAVACRKTWAELFEIVDVLVQQKPRTQSSDDAKNVSTLRPDMQAISFQVSAVHTSTAMAYRFGALFFATLLLAYMYAYGAGEDLQGGADRFAFVLVCTCLYALALVSCMSEKRYLPNRTAALSDALEVLYAVIRVCSRYGAPVSISASSLLSEVVLLHLLPRPLYDYNLPLLKPLLGVLLIRQPAAWLGIHKHLLLYWSGFTLLPKLSWLAICLSNTAGVLRLPLLRALVCTGMAAFLTLWVVYLSRLGLQTGSVAPSYVYNFEDIATVFLLALLPLNKMQELSDCLQYVLIKSEHS